MVDCDRDCRLLVETSAVALKLLVRGRKSIGCLVADGKMSLPSNGLSIVGDGRTLDSVSKPNNCSERGEDGRSDGVRGEPSDGVRDEGRIGTLLNPPMFVMDSDCGLLVETSAVALKLLVRGRKSIGCLVTD